MKHLSKLFFLIAMGVFAWLLWGKAAQAQDASVTFGPTSVPIIYPNTIAAFKQDQFQWKLTFTLNTTAGINGLASRDNSGQVDKGHLGVWVDNGRVVVRNQDIAGGGPTTVLNSTTVVQPGVEYNIIVSLSDGVEIGLLVNGNLEDSAANAFGLADNDLYLVLGAQCSTCLPDGSVPPSNPIDGTVYLEIADTALPLPEPVFGSATVAWTPPTENDDDSPLTDLAGYKLYYGQVSGGNYPNVITLTDATAVSYTVNDLPLGTYYFVATAYNAALLESVYSNEITRVVEAPAPEATTPKPPGSLR